MRGGVVTQMNNLFICEWNYTRMALKKEIENNQSANDKSGRMLLCEMVYIKDVLWIYVLVKMNNIT